jgi:hypothetical protein
VPSQQGVRRHNCGDVPQDAPSEDLGLRRLAKFVVIKKPATKAREGINRFTKAPMMFKGQAGAQVIKARPVKAAKDALL